MPIVTANDLLDSHWNGILPIDPFVIASSNLVNIQLDKTLQSDQDGPFSSILLYENDQYIILLNALEHQNRQRFAASHALGHIFCHHIGSDGSRSFRDPFSNLGGLSNLQMDYRETEANNFAAELLIPEKILKYLIRVRGITDISELAKLFVVSEKAMSFRLNNLTNNSVCHFSF